MPRARFAILKQLVHCTTQHVARPQTALTIRPATSTFTCHRMSSHGSNNNPMYDSPTPLYMSFHSDGPVYGGTHFVGSPGQIGEPSTPPIRPIPSFGSLPPHTQRPNIGRSSPRIVSQPESPRTRTPQSFRQSFRLSLARPTPEHQWSLFEQLMENEGQFTIPRSLTRRNTVNTSYCSQSSSPGPSTSASTNIDPFHSVPQSPTHRPLVDRPLVDEPFEFGPASGHSSESEDEPHEDEISSVGSSATVIPPPAPSHRFFPFKVPTIPVSRKNVLKCAVAYFLASLFTFSPYLSGFLSDISTSEPGNAVPSPTGHMMASMYAS